MKRMVTEVTYWPDGCDPDGFDATSFRVVVSWRGGGLHFAVMPVELAWRSILAGVKVNGRTWAEWRAV